MSINPPYDIAVKCIWCEHEFTLCKKEVWFNDRICPDCKKPMGSPVITMSSTHQPDGSMKEEHRADTYRLDAMVPKSKLVKFLTLMHQHDGYCHGVWVCDPDTHATWIVHLELKKGFTMQGVTWDNPPRVMAQ